MESNDKMDYFQKAKTLTNCLVDYSLNNQMNLYFRTNLVNPYKLPEFDYGRALSSDLLSKSYAMIEYLMTSDNYGEFDDYSIKEYRNFIKINLPDDQCDLVEHFPWSRRFILTEYENIMAKFGVEIKSYGSWCQDATTNSNTALMDGLRQLMATIGTFNCHYKYKAYEKLYMPTAETFEPIKSINKLEEIIEIKWKLDRRWKYIIEYVNHCQMTNDFSAFIYRGEFSVPTKQKPIPEFCAIIYFIFLKLKNIPKNRPLTLVYFFEDHETIYQFPMHKFQDGMLVHIITRKTNFVKHYQKCLGNLEK